jgi:hypothetical protein
MAFKGNATHRFASSFSFYSPASKKIAEKATFTLSVSPKNRLGSSKTGGDPKTVPCLIVL